MHGLGVVHGDAYERNIVNNRETREAFVVNFGAVLTRASLGAAAFEEECELEMQGSDYYQLGKTHKAFLGQFLRRNTSKTN
jgi:hypothetical protein